MKIKHWRKIVGAFVIVVVVMIGSLLLQLDLPKPTGSYAVGRTTLRWTDTMRAEELTTANTDNREIVVEFWYPAEQDSGTQSAYIPDLDRISTGLRASGEVSAIETFGLRFIRSEDRWNGTIAQRESQYPVILLSPGNGTNVEFYASLANELASNGYIVVGLNHPYDVAAVALTNGNVAQFIPGPIAMDQRETWVTERIATRTDDAIFALNQLVLLNESNESQFRYRMNLNHLGIMGHSLGGITAAEACRKDSRFRACLNLDGLQRGGPFSTHPHSQPASQPFMLITKEQQLSSEFLAQMQSVDSGSFYVRINGATHNSFTDAALLEPSVLPFANTADHLMSLIRQYMLGFFNQMLKTSPSPLLSTSTSNGEVLVEVYTRQ